MMKSWNFGAMSSFSPFSAFLPAARTTALQTVTAATSARMTKKVTGSRTPRSAA